MSSFDYKNSQGNRLENLQSTAHSFMAIGYRNQLFTKNLHLSLGTSYAGYGAIGSDDTVGNYMEWDVNYLEFNAGLDYELFKIKNTKFYIKGTPSVEFLLQGTQTLNNMVIESNSKPELINIDKSGANTAAIKLYNRRSYSKIKIRQCKCLNNIVEQDHRFIKWRIMLGLGFKEFESAKRTISGIEVVRMIKKNQLLNPENSTYKSFISLTS